MVEAAGATMMERPVVKAPVVEASMIEADD
jgi:hypothetical protein